MPTITKKKTKMIVKDGNGGLLQLLPETEVDAELDEESSNPVASSAVAEALSGIEDAASNMGAIKVMDEEPTALNTTEYAGETLIAWVQHESWSITINTEAETEGDRMGQIPFCLYGVEDASMKVDWGDGTIETHTSANAVQNSCLTYEYASAGEYTIKMESNDFSRLYLWTSIYGQEGEPAVYLVTLKSINESLPQIAGVHGWWYNEDIEEEEIGDNDNSFYGCFSGCTSLQSIPAGLFDNNTAATDFGACFNDCTSLQSIPLGLFDNNVAVIYFTECFYNCSSLQSIPSGLFDHNIAVTYFDYCFRGCHSIQSIPSGLFDNNVAVTSFERCFQNCTSIQSIPSGLFDNNVAVTDFTECFYHCTFLQSIPSGLFDNNVAVTSFEHCFSICSSLTDFTLHIGSSLVSNCSYSVTKKTGTTRTIYVPNNSTTQTTFNSVASSLGLTIIGE